VQIHRFSFVRQNGRFGIDNVKYTIEVYHRIEKKTEKYAPAALFLAAATAAAFI
jgi:hypothetical protein